MIDPQELVSRLTAQHRTLQSDLASAMTAVDSHDASQGADILSCLGKFKKDLVEHMDLENGVFYPDYLRKKAVRGEDITSTKEFIQQMDEIGKVVTKFLDSYASEETITASLPDFKHELSSIIHTLNMRIETEEEGVFNIYVLL